MSKDEEVLLNPVLEAIEHIDKYTEDMTREEFLEDEKTQDAVIRRLEIIGEAIKNMPKEFREENEESLWEGAAGMRDILIHQYFSVDTEVVWNTVEKTVPELKENIEDMKED
jgi:uncharacterized protein with HEPN domain